MKSSRRRTPRCAILSEGLESPRDELTGITVPLHRPETAVAGVKPAAAA